MVGAGAAERGRSLTWQNLRVSPGPDLTLSYPDQTLPGGAALAVTGPSGTGKTTLLHVLAGLLRPGAGQVRFGDLDLGTLGEGARDLFRRRHVGYVFQDFHLMPGLSALENVELGLRVAGVQSPRRRAAEVLARLDLTARLHHRPAQLSTGERQRVALARAVAHRPSLLLVDEPTAHLDRSRADGAVRLLLDTARELEATLIVVTHDPLVASALPGRLDLAGLSAKVMGLEPERA